jgi:hypothetical protein
MARDDLVDLAMALILGYFIKQILDSLLRPFQNLNNIPFVI